MITCGRCRLPKEFSEFYKRKRGGLYCYCKSCVLAEGIERQRKLKVQCVNYKGGKCIRCGYSKCCAALDFHHVDESKKDFSISKLRGTAFNDVIRNELDKCILVCCRCHREVHAELNNNAPWAEQVRKPNGLKPKKTMDRYCIDCGKSVGKKSTRCKGCVPRAFKIVWPPIKELIRMIEETNYLQTAKKLGVSDNAVRKHIKYHS